MAPRRAPSVSLRGDGGFTYFSARQSKTCPVPQQAFDRDTDRSAGNMLDTWADAVRNLFCDCDVGSGRPYPNNIIANPARRKRKRTPPIPSTGCSPGLEFDVAGGRNADMRKTRSALDRSKLRGLRSVVARHITERMDG
jgi:hypothetical protein